MLFPRTLANVTNKIKKWKQKMGDTGQWTHTCQAARCVFGLLVGLPTCGPPVARKKTAGAPPLSSSLPRGHSSLSLSASAFFPSGDDRGEWRRPCQFFVGRFAGRPGYVGSFPSLPFLFFCGEIEHPKLFVFGSDHVFYLLTSISSFFFCWF